MVKNLKGNCKVGKCFQGSNFHHHYPLPPDTPSHSQTYPKHIPSTHIKLISTSVLRCFPFLLYLPAPFLTCKRCPIALGVRENLEVSLPLLHFCFLPPRQEDREDVDSCIPTSPTPLHHSESPSLP